MSQFHMPETIIRGVRKLIDQQMAWIEENPEFRLDKINAVAHYANVMTQTEIAKYKRNITDPANLHTLDNAEKKLLKLKSLREKE